MGSCASIHRNSASSGKFRASLVHSETDKHLNSMPCTPVKNNPPNILLLDRPIYSQLTSFSNYGSKEEAFFDSQPWLESDCDDDFYSVNGDFTPSRGSTPLHGRSVGTPRRTLSPLVNRSMNEARPPVYNGAPPLDRRRATSQVVDLSGANSWASPTDRKKMSLVDLFRESTRENQEGEFYHDVKNETPKSSNTTPCISGTNSHSNSSSCERTPTETGLSEKEKHLKSSQCCFPRLSSARGFQKTPIAVDA